MLRLRELLDPFFLSSCLFWSLLLAGLPYLSVQVADLPFPAIFSIPTWLQSTCYLPGECSHLVG